MLVYNTLFSSFIAFSSYARIATVTQQKAHELLLEEVSSGKILLKVNRFTKIGTSIGDSTFVVSVNMQVLLH